jgi:hypothetical protein
MFNEEFCTDNNLKIWQTARTLRRVWEIDPISGAVVEYRDEIYKKYRGRYHWYSHLDTTWSNPDFCYGPGAGKMSECPPLPPELIG